MPPHLEDGKKTATSPYMLKKVYDLYIYMYCNIVVYTVWIFMFIFHHQFLIDRIWEGLKMADPKIIQNWSSRIITFISQTNGLGYRNFIDTPISPIGFNVCIYMYSNRKKTPWNAQRFHPFYGLNLPTLVSEMVKSQVPILPTFLYWVKSQHIRCQPMAPGHHIEIAGEGSVGRRKPMN